jgi:rhomboid protease GluP
MNASNFLNPSSPSRPVRVVRRDAWVTYTMLGVTIVIYLAQLLTQNLFGTDIPAALGAKVNALIAQGQFWRLLTPVWLHGGILHIGFNMYALYIIGPGLERNFGHGRFLLLYLLTGFAGNVLSYLFTAAPSYGASTAIFGLIAAEVVYLLRNKGVLQGNVQGVITNRVMILAVNLMLGFSSSGVDNFGHLGGMLGGLIFGWLAGPLYDASDFGYQIKDKHSATEIALVSLLIVAGFGALAFFKG